MAKKQEPSFVEIDESALDEEWLNQPRFYYEHASQLAEAKREFDYAKAKLETTYAELDFKIRSSPEDYELEKVTEGAVKNAILYEEEYQDAMKEVNDARYEVEMLNAAVQTLEHRKRALEKLVDLHGQNYFSAPRASSDATDRMEKKTKYRKGIKEKNRKK